MNIFFFLDRYRVDLRSRYQDRDQRWQWGRGVSFYLNEFEAMLRESCDLIALAHPKSKKEQLFTLIEAAVDEISALLPKEDPPFKKIRNVKEEVEKFVQDKIKTQSLVRRHTTNERFLRDWPGELTFLKSHIITCVTAKEAYAAYMKLEKDPKRREEEVLADSEKSCEVIESLSQTQEERQGQGESVEDDDYYDADNFTISDDDDENLPPVPSSQLVEGEAKISVPTAPDEESASQQIPDV